ncbi:CAF17-like 4Fe-4S cluster assembly/insertion protein YgfZ [Orrella daihaiensis]|uniref:Folate-binding protein YgfZ n=1 Tax=Orrella daihaiensis TaxID=2782176 RepID=A0ABY4AMT6_9BURK|nr:folate-binding protein [Orrella daihaiensis]UOD49354.1 folate-binding protein YgfZ [Orrella daihaiensis]
MSSFTTPVFITPCQHLSIFSAVGADTRAFLQSQLTQDVSLISPSQAAMAGFCTAQGRLWATMLLTPTDQEQQIHGVIAADLMESLLKRLRMFVLRSKVTLGPVPDLQVLGIEVAAADFDVLSSTLEVTLPGAIWQAQMTSCGTWIQVPSANENCRLRLLALTTARQAEQIVDQLGENGKVLTDVNAWKAQDVQAGMAWVEASTQDLFIAQTLNLDLIGGVSFTKGCYPGQEVIARAHYRGTVKRRMHVATIVSPTEVEMKAGMDVFDASDPDNPVGRLINVANTVTKTDEGPVTIWVLFEAPFKSIETASLRVGSSEGPLLTMQPMPYDIAPT